MFHCTVELLLDYSQRTGCGAICYFLLEEVKELRFLNQDVIHLLKL